MHYTPPLAHVCAAVVALALPAVPLAAQTEPSPPLADAAQPPAIAARADQVIALLNGTIEPADLFTDGFRAAIADTQIKGLSASLTAQFGPALTATLAAPRSDTRAALEIRFERGLAKGGIAIDPAQQNRVSELLFTSVDSLAVPDDTPQKIAADLNALPGNVNALFVPLEGGAPVISINADRPLALGSAIKLYVLAALGEDIALGKRQWHDHVPLTARSFPSGQLQDWPQGAPLTLHTLASLMIAISDNTATDQLIAVLGKDRIIKLMRDSGHANPKANIPLLTTRELFMMKASGEARIAAYRSSDAAARAGILAEVGQADMTRDQINAAFGKGPQAIDIEWFAAPSDLARLLGHMRRACDPAVFAIMAINPSATPAIRARWDYVGYKGGSEPGVLNLTWLLRDKAGAWHMLTLGWNNPAAVIDQGKLEAIAQRILMLASTAR
ncbi:serine hydrolase [Porphyrobacter sp. TH134]|uniref:serine hydrolase n=1 Tax=Porphyrobacter sp. TH134 TaxID=2067450 RepID=UPI000C7C0480|nr:serine hydrolase [Porphyrobacter sp. TH134]PLK22852.1 serine hydrolase [Porphyrobacter sp. TH134]